MPVLCDIYIVTIFDVQNSNSILFDECFVKMIDILRGFLLKFLFVWLVISIVKMLSI